jgi:hypothetical protein
MNRPYGHASNEFKSNLIPVLHVMVGICLRSFCTLCAMYAHTLWAWHEALQQVRLPCCYHPTLNGRCECAARSLS